LKEKGTIVAGGNGTQKFGATSVADITRLIPDIATHPNAANKSVVIQGDFISGEELATLIEKQTGNKLDVPY
jgi:nucleoside-diphosphate-sugar epimerase